MQGGAASSSERLPTEDDFFAPIAEVTSAARLEKSVLEMGASVTIIDRDMIEASTAIEIPDLLRLVPGFQVAHASGTLFSAAYHGASDQWPRRMEVLVDGRSVYLSTYSSVEWSALGLAMEDVERIEVIRGPNAPTFGNNAVIGSINIVTRDPFLLQGKYVRGTIGSQDTGIGVGRIGVKFGNWNASLTAQYREDDGFDAIDDHKRITDLRLRADYEATSADTVSVQAGFSGGEMGADGQDTDSEPFRDRDISSHYQQLTWNRSQPDGGRYRLNFYHQYYDSDDSFDVDISDAIPNAYMPLGWYVVTTERYDLEFQHNLAPADTWRFAWGMGGRWDKLTSDLMLHDLGSVAKYSGRLFGSSEWRPVNEVLLSFDVLSEWHESHGSETSPRIAINWLVSNSRSFRASASRSHHVFNLLGRYIDYPVIASDGTFIRQLVISKAEDDFTPERVTGFELGYTENWGQLGLLLDLRLFHDRLENVGLQARRPDGAAVGLDRAGGWTTEGFEAQVDYRPSPDTRFVGAYSRARIDGEVAESVDWENTILDYARMDRTIPRNTFSFLLSHRFNERWKGSLALYHIDDMQWRGEGSEVDAYTRLDLKLARTFRAGDTSAEISCIVQNLLDDKYNEFRVPGTYDRYGNVFGRRAYLQVSLGFE